MNPLIVAAVVGFGSYQAPPPPYFLTGYYSQPVQVQHVTIPGPVVQPNTAMFRILPNRG